MCTPETKLDIPSFKTKTLPRTPVRSLEQRGKEDRVIRKLKNLKEEFSEKNYLEFFHAATILFIRNHLNLQHCLSNFWTIWNEEAEFMISHLNSRWLVSACDTIIDYSEDPDEVAAAMTATLFINTIKLYETERFVQPQAVSDGFDMQQVDRAMPSRQTHLFDGIQGYTIGRGDMIRNLLNRIMTHSNSRISSAILKELIRRAATHNTIFKRLREVHINEKTRWWPL